MAKLFISFLVFITCLLLFGCADDNSQPETKQPELVVNALSFPASADVIRYETDQLLIELDRIAAEIKAVSSSSFNSVILPLNDLVYRYNTASRRNHLLFSAAESAYIRDAALQGNDRLDQWWDTLDDDKVIALKVGEIPLPRSGEQIELHKKMQNMFFIGSENSAEISLLQGQINDLAIEFQSNLNNAEDKVILFSPGEMEGISEWLLADFERDADGNYLMLSYNYTHLINITFNAIHEQSRKKAVAAYLSLGIESNPQILEEIIRLRSQIANSEGYGSHAERVFESRMVKTPATALAFLERLGSAIQQPVREELAPRLQLKVEETNNPDAILNYWDMSYYGTKLYNSNANAQPVTFRSPLFTVESILIGVFNLCEELFSLRIVPQQTAENQTWHEDVSYYVVEDIDTGQPLGSFYLDMYPREGKYNHFALFPIETGNTVADASLRYLPVVAMLGNFTASNTDRPVYLLPDQIEIIFHEFGHLMHSLLYAGQSGLLYGFSVPSDFLEVPSELMQKAARNPEVLLRSCTNNQGGDDPFSFEMMQTYVDWLDYPDALNTSANIGFSILDLKLHSQANEKNVIDSIALGNEIMTNYYLPVPEESAWVASFSHLVTGYDANYYSYLWSDAIATDLLSVFRNSPRGFYDAVIGKKLRDEVFAPGASRDVNESVREFLGRDWNSDAYLDSFSR